MTLKNNKGIALVTALMFTLISLGIIMMLLSSIIQGSKITGANKTYKTALDAGFGGAELVAKNLMPSLYQGIAKTDLITNLSGISLSIPSGTCFDEKFSKSTANWSTTACSAPNKTFAASDTPDITFNLKASNDLVGFRVYTKIVDTRCGGDTAAGQPCSNADATGIDYLDSGGGVTGGQPGVGVSSKPAYYRIEVQAERASNPREKSQLSVLYAY